MRLLAGILVGAVAWLAAVTALGLVLGRMWPEMAAITDMKALTLAMLAARLTVSGIASIVSGFAAALIARERVRAALGAGILLLVVFVPYHLTIWANFPVWYHLTFFVSLPVLSLLGGALSPKR